MGKKEDEKRAPEPRKAPPLSKPVGRRSEFSQRPSESGSLRGQPDNSASKKLHGKDHS